MIGNENTRTIGLFTKNNKLLLSCNCKFGLIERSYKTKFSLLPDQDSADNYRDRSAQDRGDDDNGDDLESLMSEPPFS